MRLGKVYLSETYVVDLDDEEMIEHAREAIYEDVRYAVLHEEISSWIDIKEDTSLNEKDIPSFLIEEEES